MIRAIQPGDWPTIMVIQAEVYDEITPEPLSVLQGKWHRSPDLCFVYEYEGAVQAYLLAHSWAGTVLPSLGVELATGVGDEYVFLHDLAVSSKVQGSGIGPKLVERLFLNSAKAGLNTVFLVSVQASVSYWQRFGFCSIPQSLSPSYGVDAVVMKIQERETNVLL